MKPSISSRKSNPGLTHTRLRNVIGFWMLYSNGVSPRNPVFDPFGDDCGEQLLSNNSQFENYSWQKSSFKLAQIYLVCSLSVLNKIWRVSLEKKNIDLKPPQQGKLEIRNSKYYQTARNVSRRNFDDICLIHFWVISLETDSEQSGCSNSRL